MTDTKHTKSGQDVQTLVDKLDPKYFFFELPLYEKVLTPTEQQRNRLRLRILNFNDEFNAYNFRLKENSTFEGSGNYHNAQYELTENFSIIHITLKCKRTDEKYDFYVMANKDRAEKIGQYPSLADLNIGLIKEYKDVLSEEKLKEFIRGIGLRAHGVGIGSFVYLRRIFEYLIEQEHLAAKNVSDWDEDLYQKSRMTKKIDLLTDYLPEFLVENKDLYSILSLGVHELSEKECLKYFDALKMGIQEILEEKVIEAQRKKRKEEAKTSLQSIRQTIGKKQVSK